MLIDIFIYLFVMCFNSHASYFNLDAMCFKPDVNCFKLDFCCFNLDFICFNLDLKGCRSLPMIFKAVHAFMLPRRGPKLKKNVSGGEVT